MIWFDSGAVADSDAHHSELWWCDGGRLYAYDVTVWDGRALPDADARLSPGAGAVRNCVAIAADRTEGRVWTGHADGTVQLWSVVTGRSGALPFLTTNSPTNSTSDSTTDSTTKSITDFEHLT